jgi:hypothetical protein
MHEYKNLCRKWHSAPLRLVLLRPLQSGNQFLAASEEQLLFYLELKIPNNFFMAFKK